MDFMALDKHYYYYIPLVELDIQLLNYDRLYALSPKSDLMVGWKCIKDLKIKIHNLNIHKLGSIDCES